MISGTFSPSACERFWTVIPDSTVTGPVCGTISRGCFGCLGVSSRRCRESGRGRAAPLSITTRRFLPALGFPWRGLTGLLGLLGPLELAIRWVSVET